ncbi:MAG: capsid protein [Methylocystis sp.]|nr:MAG: capsid protein [Methylocystis sp.]
MPDKRPFVSNAAMTAIAIGYSNPAIAMIADRALPRVPVPTESFKWLRYNDDEAFSVPETRIGRKGRLNEVEFTATEESGSVKTYGLKSVIPLSDINVAKAQRDKGLSTYDPRLHTTAMLTELMLLDRERRVAAMYQNAANYEAGNITAIANAADRFDVDTGDPEAIIDAAINGVFIVRPNTCAMSEQVWQKMRRNVNLVKAIKGTTQADGKITQREFSEYFEIQNVLIGAAWVNTARPGQAANMQRAWGKHISFVYIDRMARPEGGVTWGFSPEFGSRVAGTIPDPDVGLEGGEEIRVGERVDELVVAKKAGAFIQNAIS